MKTWLATLWGLAVLSAGTARAQEQSGSAPPATEAQAAQPQEQYRPIGTIRASVLSGFPDLLGVSVSMTMIQPLEVEFGGSTMFVLSSVFARAGVSLPLANLRDPEGAGWTLHAPLLLGYRYVQSVSFDSARHFSGVTFDAGVDATLWTGPHFGWNFELLLGGAYWVYESSTTSTLFIPDARLTVGFAF